MNKLIIVGGATASGKSSLAIKIAKSMDSQVISCDSMQIYRHMDIGTAKITAQEMCGVKHHMIDVVEPDKEYSVWEYKTAASAIINDLHSRGKIPVIAGGTGLYVQSLIYPMNFAVNKDEHVREQLMQELQQKGAEALHEELAKADPEDAAKIHPNNTKRLIRALEIFRISGSKKKSEETQKLLYDVLLLIPQIDRQLLYQRIEERVEQMFEQGLKEEVDNLLHFYNVNFQCQSMQAIGYKEFEDYYKNNASLDDVKNEIKLNTRHYAKRQLSWFRRYEFAKYVDPCNDEEITNTVQNFLRG